MYRITNLLHKLRSIVKTKYYIIKRNKQVVVVSSNADISAIIKGPLYRPQYLSDSEALAFWQSFAYLVFMVAPNCIYNGIITTIIAHFAYGCLVYLFGHRAFIIYMKKEANAIVRGPFDSKKEAELVYVLSDD